MVDTHFKSKQNLLLYLDTEEILTVPLHILLEQCWTFYKLPTFDSLRPFYANLMMHNDPCLKAFLRSRVEIMKVVF